MSYDIMESIWLINTKIRFPILKIISGITTFDPKHAVVVQNKDEVLIPLITEVLPSAKEFKDATVVCIIQLKPQLERVLNLLDGALTKEIQLTQQLVSLFIDYQIPSDLLSYDGPSSSDEVGDISMKVNAVNKKLCGCCSSSD